MITINLRWRISDKNLFLRSLGAHDANSNYLSWLQDNEVIKYLEIHLNLVSRNLLNEMSKKLRILKIVLPMC